MGQHIRLTATVKVVGRVRGAPRGIVTFTNGTNVLGSAPLRRGKAVLTTSALALGDDTVQASYSGAPNLTASQSLVRIELITASRKGTSHG